MIGCIFVRVLEFVLAVYRGDSLMVFYKTLSASNSHEKTS